MKSVLYNPRPIPVTPPFLSLHLAVSVFVCLVAIHIEESKSVFVRGPPASRVRLPLIIYFAGFVVNLGRRLKMFGCRHAFSYYHWNKYDVVMTSFFGASFLCWLLSWRETLFHDAAWRRMPRACWSPFETTLWGEALFAVAACMSYVRVIYWYCIYILLAIGAIFLYHYYYLSQNFVYTYFC